MSAMKAVSSEQVETSASSITRTGLFGSILSWWNSLSQRDAIIVGSVTAIGVSTVVWAVWNQRAKYIPGVPLGFPDEWQPYTGHLGVVLRMINKKVYQQEIEAEHQRCYEQGIECFQFNTGIRCRESFYACTPEMVKEIFVDRCDEFVKGEVIIEMMREMLGRGIFTVDPPESTLQRKSLEPMFSMRNMKNLMFECGTNAARLAMKKLESLCESESELKVDMFDMTGRFTLSSFLEISFGRTIVDIIDDYPKNHPFSVSFDRLQYISIVSRLSDPLWKVKRYLGVGKHERMIIEDAHTLDEFAGELIGLSSRSEAQNIFDESGMEKFDIISLYLKNKPDASEKELRDIAMNMVIAGRDTTRVLLSWFLWCYGSGFMNEGQRARLDEELASVIQDGESAEDVTYTLVNEKLKFTEQCILEVLRMFPPVKYLMRSPRKDGTKMAFTNPDGSPQTVYLDQSVWITVSTFGCHRTEAFFDEPLVFKPERWTKGVNTFPEHVFLSFNLMPRLCLGRHFAIMEAKIFLVHFFHHFKFELENKEMPIITPGPMLNMQYGLPVFLTNKHVK